MYGGTFANMHSHKHVDVYARMRVYDGSRNWPVTGPVGLMGQVPTENAVIRSPMTAAISGMIRSFSRTSFFSAVRLRGVRALPKHSAVLTNTQVQL